MTTREKVEKIVERVFERFPAGRTLDEIFDEVEMCIYSMSPMRLDSLGIDAGKVAYYQKDGKSFLNAVFWAAHD